MTKLGIIPAAGKGTRFGGLYKELLPIGDGETMLSRAVDTLEMIPVDSMLIVTSHYKINAHCAALNNRAVKYAIQRDYERDAWGAIVESLDCAGDWNYYLMPDTWIMQGIIPDTERDFTLGLFNTMKPERFGVVDDGEIVDKSTTFSGERQAWGVVIWSRRVVDFWKRHLSDITSHTQAFNMAMREFGYGAFEIPVYIDIASFSDYKRLLQHV